MKKIKGTKAAGAVHVELLSNIDGSIVLLATSADAGSAIVKFTNVREPETFIYNLYKTLRNAFLEKPRKQ